MTADRNRLPLHRYLSNICIATQNLSTSMTPRRSHTGKSAPPRQRIEFPPADSSGHLVRDANRAFQRVLEKRLAPYGVTRGQWYFLRALWTEDGLSQRELSARVGMMEPTTVIALRGMEKAGLIRRVRSADDRRKAQVWLTAKARRLRGELLALARRITAEAEAGLARRDWQTFRSAIAHMTANLDRIKA
jgi:DNA-binding MarR family transcriptional regulator